MKHTRSGGRRDWAAAGSALVKSVADDEPVESIVGEVARHALGLLGLDMCAVMLPAPSNDQLIVVGSAGLSSDYIERLHSEHPLRVDRSGATLPSPSVEAFLSGSTVAVPDIQQSEGMTEWRELALAEGYAALIATPLSEGDTITGVIVGYARKVRNFSLEQVDLLEMFAVHAGATIVAARRRDALRRANDELHAANRSLRDQSQALETVDRQHRRLMQVMSNDVGLSGVVTMLAELLDSSVTVEDAQGRTMASATRGAYVAPPSHAERATSAIGSAISQAGAAKVGAILIDAGSGATIPFWLAPISLHHEVVAYLWVGRPGLVLDEVGRRGIERFALAIALEISKQRSTAQVRLRMSRDLVSDLLGDIDARDIQSLIERGEALGHDLLMPHIIALLRPDRPGPEASDRLVRVVESITRSRFGDVLIGSAGGDAILLVPESRSAAAVVDAVVGEYARKSDAATASAVIGGRADSISAIAGQTRIARGALGLMASREGGRGRTADLTDLGVGALLLSHGDARALNAFADNLLAPLDRLDEQRAQDLIRTLRLWLDLDRSVNRTADALTVHPNTVGYRIKSLEEQFGRSIRDPEFIVEIRMAMLIRELSGSLSAATTTPQPSIRRNL